MGLLTEHVLVAADLPTDRYMAIEAAGGLIAAVADARSLERVGGRIPRPFGRRPSRLRAGPLPRRDGHRRQPDRGAVARDRGEPRLRRRRSAAGAREPGQGGAPAPTAGPSARDALRQSRGGRADRGDSLRHRARTAPSRCWRRVRGGRLSPTVTARWWSATGDGLVSAMPPGIEARRITGAGDTFMAAHIAAELGGSDRAEALGFAVGGGGPLCGRARSWMS